jgi:RHS repeat-associated protein
VPLAALLLLVAVGSAGSGFCQAPESDLFSAQCQGSPNARDRARVNVHVCRYVHDGLGRMIKQVCDLRVGGTGAGALDTSNPRNPDGQIALGYVFDGNSRLTGIVDDNGNRTSFGYDALDRKTSHTFADGKSYAFTYDLDSNVKTVTDPNGSVITKTYDALNRLVELDVARGAGVVGTTRETYSYDGVSRLVRSTDDNGAVAATQVWEGAYDSLGRMLEERQNGRAVSSRYTGDGKRESVTYAGGRTITRGFDVLDRITQLADTGGPLATSDWIGSGLRELRRQNRNGTQLTFLNDVGNQDLGFDAVQRITRLRVLGAGGPASPIVDREYGYNRASQRTFEKRNDDHGLTDRYTYDSSYRIFASSFDQDGLPGAVARDLSQVGYRYDGVGNRRDVSKTTTSVGVLAESYGVNALNQYTSIAAGATPAVVRDHDDNGNLTDDGTKLLSFDYKNRLVGAQRKSDSAPIALYSYLADGRRVRKQVWNPDGGALVRDTRFVLDGAQEVEEQDWSSGATTTTYVWSPVYVDELVEFMNAGGSFFAHQDARCDVVAVTNAAGAVVERRRFDDFGRVEVRGAGGAVVAPSPSELEYGFQGRRFDPETGLVFFRARYYSPETGRFVQRDPVWDAGNVGGQYTFCGNGPGSGRDPSGLSGAPSVTALLDQARTLGNWARGAAAAATLGKASLDPRAKVVGVGLDAVALGLRIAQRHLEQAAAQEEIAVEARIRGAMQKGAAEYATRPKSDKMVDAFTYLFRQRNGGRDPTAAQQQAAREILDKGGDINEALHHAEGGDEKGVQGPPAPSCPITGAGGGSGGGGESPVGTGPNGEPIFETRHQAFRDAKRALGLRPDQQPERVWSVRGPTKVPPGVPSGGLTVRDPNPRAQGRIYEFRTADGFRYIADHSNDAVHGGVGHMHIAQSKARTSLPRMEPGDIYQEIGTIRSYGRK